MYSLFKKLLFTLDPETTHNLAKRAAPILPLLGCKSISSPVLKASIGGTKLENPIGLAAGFDKNGNMLGLASALGFGFTEIGSVTSIPCKGNPRPRIFRLPKDESIINRMGLPNQGADAVAKRLAKTKDKIPYGINIAKTPDNYSPPYRSGIEDFLATFDKLKDFGKYIVFNLSCPNTAGGKTFEEPEVFKKLAKSVADVRKKMAAPKPILIKISPDLEEKKLFALVESACSFGFDGFVMTNTTLKRPNLKTGPFTVGKMGVGGLSGGALAKKADEQLSAVHQMAPDKILIGVGGIINFEGLLNKLSRGASLFQIYTGLVYG
ncbi:MAG: quinone-dependent dihydroorotate dehydrogenase, partial [Deltaproteobacteria bacterium]|nr:quinone-dependent dihydroorotate dehydrogenase [Deltaproteobacteria bacterium]